MNLKGVIQPTELAKRIESEAGKPPSDRKLRIYDATIEFQRTDDGKTSAIPGHASYLTAHIEGARFVDHQAELSDGDSGYGYTLLPPNRLTAALRSIGINNDSVVVIYSTAHIMWATRLWWILNSCGLEEVYVLDGGFNSWQSAGLPVSSGSETYPTGDIDIEFSPERWADKREVEASIGSGSVCTINALTEKMHQGTSSVHYGRPGHIPSSVNVPFDDFLEQGKLLPSSALRSRLDEVEAFEKERVVTYCGGGIAATLAAFALENLGHPNVGVYDGSLTEWTADESMPMETDG